MQDLTGKLQNSVIVFGLRYKGLNVSSAGCNCLPVWFSCYQRMQLNRPLLTVASGSPSLLLLLLLLHCCRCHRQRMQVQTMQKFRRGVPENSTVFVCKNSLLKEATQQVPGWETLADAGCTVSINVDAAAWAYAAGLNADISVFEVVGMPD